LRMLIINHKGISAGDAVVYCDLDYPEMICAMQWLGDHRGAQVVKFAMPEPATTANVLAAYDEALRGAPNARLLLVTQVSNRTGLVTPVREIVAMARQRGVDTVVDAAHGIACLDFMLDDLGADFVGWSVHKWTSAPLGTGAMYIRKSRIIDIEIAYDDDADPPADIAARVPTGTVDFAAVSSIPKQLSSTLRSAPLPRSGICVRCVTDGYTPYVTYPMWKSACPMTRPATAPSPASG
jgi:selenocysteine lyase/cysteine desulfurase